MPEKIIDKNYGSIPHLSTSKLTQQADKKIHLGQEKLLTEKTRTWKDLIIVTEKIDGSNVGVIKKDGQLIAITRAGYPALSSPYRHHHLFHSYVKKNFYKFSWLPEGWRIVGEWCVMAHGTIYDITDESPFVAFDIITSKNERLTYIEFLRFCYVNLIASPRLIHIGQPISIKNAVKILQSKIGYGGTSEHEGIVYRLECDGKVDFLAKWVRADKEDGKYMKEEVWNTGFNLSNY